MKTQKKSNIYLRSVLIGAGIAVLYLLIGLVLDYLVTQLLSQFVIQDCSEDCYFQVFNALFIVVALLSIAGGVLRGVRTYKHLSENG